MIPEIEINEAFNIFHQKLRNWRDYVAKNSLLYPDTHMTEEEWWEDFTVYSQDHDINGKRCNTEETDET